MTKYFHHNLNRMTLFTALLAAGVLFFWNDFMRVATSSIYLNGIIIGTTLFGIGLCFVEMFKLLPEYRWLQEYTSGRRRAKMPPRLLKSVALVLQSRPNKIAPATLNGLLDMILIRFEDSRESVRYITNTLVFLGLLGTFWGLILTIGGFADLIGNLNFDDEAVMTAMQNGLSRPLAGMATAFTSSLLGLAGSLTVGFLGLQVQLAQNSIFRELEDYMASRTIAADASVAAGIRESATELTNSVRELQRTVSEFN